MRELKGVVPNQTAISCSSEELAKQVLIILKECGYTWDIGWQYGKNYNTKQVTLEQLAEILDVHQFKIGDRVKIKESSECYGYNNESNPRDTLGSVSKIRNKEYDITVKWDNGRNNKYRSKIDLELVTEAKPEQYISVTRENLGKIHSAVCGGWKAKIEELLEKADKVSRWCNVYDETNHSQEGVGRYVYTSKEDAILKKSQIGYITTIELTVEYETEV